MKKLTKHLPSHLFILFILVVPASTNYQLNQFGFNSGGSVNHSSTNYSGNSSVGDPNGANSTSTNYQLNPGLINTFQANVPGAPTLTNSNNYYDKLQLVLNTSGNASDTKYAAAISRDNFATTQYVKSDNTVGSTLASTDYRTYASWGSGAGITIIGLIPSTSYKVKATAMEGRLTQSSYGPASNATSTVAPQITFSLSPTSVNFGNLAAGSVVSAPSNITATLDTNADSGAVIFIASKNAGVRSSSANFTIPSATADLASASSGYGAQIASATQTSGGPLTSSAPFNVSSTNVGALSTTIQSVFLSAVPITGGSGQILLKAKASGLTPASTDYSDTLTIVAAANF